MNDDDCVSTLINKMEKMKEKTELLLKNCQEYLDLWTIEENIMSHQQKIEDLYVLNVNFGELHELVMQRDEKINSIVKHQIK